MELLSNLIFKIINFYKIRKFKISHHSAGHILPVPPQVISSPIPQPDFHPRRSYSDSPDYLQQ